MTERIIIENRSNHTMQDAMRYVAHVIEDGRISNDSKAYCYVTTWPDGTVVQAVQNKRSDRFVITQEKG